MLQVKVWDGVVFPTYDAAFAAGGITGKSILFDYWIPPNELPPGSDLMNNFRGFTLVPEPSAQMLAALGLVAGFLVIKGLRNQAKPPKTTGQ